MKKMLLNFFVLLFATTLFAQENLHVYPTHWWTGMKDPHLQLMIHAKDIARGKREVVISYPGVKIRKVAALESPNYLFVDLDLAGTVRPGQFQVKVQTKDPARVYEFSYRLQPKSTADGKTRVQGVTARDFIYLLMPDHFADGDPKNDVVAGYRDETCDRQNPYTRHGGDLEGVEDHLDYFRQLGVTSIWMTPVLENDMPLMKEGDHYMAGYHGYWMTDHYQVDKRFGGNEAYRKLVEAAHKKGLKIIQDAVYNHVGSYHWFVLDPPSHDWLNQWPSYTAPNHREEAIFDRNGSDSDYHRMIAGWFVPHLPDLNLANPYLARYMIQQAIWSTEEFGIDGWRVDTYKYCDEHFLNAINDALLKEFPRLTVFGEAWTNTIIGNAYFTRNNFKTGFHHNLQGVTDFPLCFSLHDAMTQPFGWTSGVNRIYMTLAQDFVYQDPSRNCLFLDNHDMDRIYSVVGEDWNKLKMGLNWLLTLKEIPQLYYGTEILMKNFKNPNDAQVRKDFPGGWASDSVNKFLPEGRTAAEDSAFTYISRLAHFRQQATAISGGKLMQYVPQNGFYVYFRYNEKQTIAVASNTGNQEASLADSRYTERTRGFHHLRNVITGAVYSLEDFRLAPGDSQVLELLR